MLAAIPKKASEPGLFRLVLSLSKKPESQIPTSLISKFNEILNQAKLLAKDENSDTKFIKIHPEAIELALEIKLANEWSNQINDLQSFEALTPEIADGLLEKMEFCSVY